MQGNVCHILNGVKAGGSALHFNSKRASAYSICVLPAGDTIIVCHMYYQLFCSGSAILNAHNLQILCFCKLCLVKFQWGKTTQPCMCKTVEVIYVERNKVSVDDHSNAGQQQHVSEPSRKNLTKWCNASRFLLPWQYSFKHFWWHERVCLPLVALWVGWHQGVALPGFDCSGISHRGQYAGCNVACPPTRRGGCSATEECTSACPAAVGDMVAGATEISSSEGEGQ